MENINLYLNKLNPDFAKTEDQLTYFNNAKADAIHCYQSLEKYLHKDKKIHWKYNIHKSGFNYRLSDINCALGLSQLNKINKFINYRKKIFQIYRTSFKRINNFIRKY